MMTHPESLVACGTVSPRASSRRGLWQPTLLFPAIAALLCSAPPRADAQELMPRATAVGPSQPGKHRRIEGIHFDPHPGWSVGLEAFAGLSTLTTSERTKGHALAGGVSRVRFDVFEIGGMIDSSDLVDERWRSVGGFVGAFLPYTNWVDFDATVGVSARNWISKDTRYGAGGASVRVPTLNFRFGVSDRTSEGLLSPRLSAALLVAVDMKHRDMPWSYTIRNVETLTGTTPFGGTTIAIVAGFGFDVGKRWR